MELSSDMGSKVGCCEDKEPEAWLDDDDNDNDDEGEAAVSARSKSDDAKIRSNETVDEGIVSNSIAISDNWPHFVALSCQNCNGGNWRPFNAVGTACPSDSDLLHIGWLLPHCN